MEVSRLSGGWLEEMPFVLRSDWAISGERGSNAPCWKVLQEQIWRRHPVNKEPAETSCEQHGTEMCDFKRGLLVTDSWWSVYHFPLSYCHWIWRWRKAGELSLRKYEETEKQMFIFCASWPLSWSVNRPDPSSSGFIAWMFCLRWNTEL